MPGFFSKSEIGKQQPSTGTLKCGLCGLYKTCITPKMPPYGKGRKKILLISGSPSTYEDKKGRPFRSKKIVEQNLFNELGYDVFKDCWRTNAVICCPPKGTKITHEMINTCRPGIAKIIKELKPRVIILLGSHAIESLMGVLYDRDVTMKPWLGWQIPSQNYNAWICPTHNPSHFKTGYRGRDEREANPVAIKLFRQHIKAAIQLSKARPWETVPDYNKEVDLITDTDKAANILWAMKTKGGTIAFDYETNCLKPETPKSAIYSCSVSWEGKKTIAYPWHGKAIEATRDLLRSPVKKIASNLKFEHRWTKAKLNMDIKNWHWDTMLAAHTINNTPGITSIKFQALALLGLREYDTAVSEYLKSEGGYGLNRIHEMDVRDLLLYNGLDSLLEFKVAQIQKKVMGIL